MLGEGLGQGSPTLGTQPEISFFVLIRDSHAHCPCGEEAGWHHHDMTGKRYHEKVAGSHDAEAHESTLGLWYINSNGYADPIPHRRHVGSLDSSCEQYPAPSDHTFSTLSTLTRLVGNSQLGGAVGPLSTSVHPQAQPVFFVPLDVCLQ
jgi:hypothetical protein